jgi:hypothetical protein
MINFKELIKERDAAKLRIDEINNRIDSIRMKNDVVPHTLNQELISTEEYHKQLILRIGRSLTDEDVAEPKEVVLDLDEEDINEEDIETTPFSKLIKVVIDEEDENLKQEVSFNPANILQAIAGVEVLEESDEVDEEQCGCKDCTSEEDDAEDITGSIVKAFMLMGAIKALEAKKEGK